MLPKLDDKWNLRYVAYARCHGRPPQEQLDFDKQREGACMLPFIEWNDAKWREFEVTTNTVGWIRGESQQREYDEWLSTVTQEA